MQTNSTSGVEVNSKSCDEKTSAISCFWPVCVWVWLTSNLPHPDSRSFTTMPAQVTKAIPQAPLASDNNSCRVTRTAGVPGLTGTRSNQSEQLVFYWSATSWHITQRNLHQVNVGAHIPPFGWDVGAGSVSGTVRLVEDVSFIPGPHRQGDLMTSGGINSTHLTPSCITERLENVGAITTTHHVMVSLIKSCAPFIFIVF